MKFTAKIFFGVVALIFCINQSVYCETDNYGTLEPQQLALGYISITSKPSDILNIYGHPSRVDNSNGVRWFYGKDFYVQFMGRGATTISEVTTTSNNGITTTNKVAVGMSESILRRVYGTPKYQKQRGNEDCYWYYGYGRYSNAYLFFSCTKGTIRKISLVLLD
ncbi:MAG: hypothetical protein IJ685_13235 [Selenomonadaceae bacterium]|nr:hypothetical protein [Selenomonadaceae bacterium]